MQVSRWGNSLAVRIPVDVVRALDLKEGDSIDLCSLEDGRVAVISERQRKADAIAGLRAFRGWMPADFTFNRDDANER